MPHKYSEMEKAYRQKPEVKERARAAALRYYYKHGPQKSIEERRAYLKAYNQRAEVKKRQKALRQRPEARELYATRQRAYNRTPRGREISKAWNLKKLYGLSLEAFNALLASQGGACAVCGTTDWGPVGPVVDHNHEPDGKVRGILCAGCNLAIGHLRDSPGRARAIADYLEKK